MGKEPLPHGVPVPMGYSAPCIALGDKGAFPQLLCPLSGSGLTLQAGVPEALGSPGPELGAPGEAHSRPLHKDLYLGRHCCLSGLILSVPCERYKHNVLVVKRGSLLFLSPPTGEHLFYQLPPPTLTFLNSLPSPTMSPLSLLRHWSLASVRLHLSLSLFTLRAF